MSSMMTYFFYIHLKVNLLDCIIFIGDALMENLKILRTNKKITQSKMAKYLGVGRTTYTQYETGVSEPNRDTILKLSDYFKVPPSFLLDAKPFTQWEKLSEHKGDVLEALAQWGDNDEYAKFLKSISDDIDYINIVNAWLDDIAFNDNNEIIIYPRIPQDKIRNSVNEIMKKAKKNKPVSEEDRLRKENYELFDQLPKDKQQEALNYLRFLVEHQEKE